MNVVSPGLNPVCTFSKVKRSLKEVSNMSFFFLENIMTSGRDTELRVKLKYV